MAHGNRQLSTTAAMMNAETSFMTEISALA